MRGIVLGAESIDTALVRLASEAELRRLTDGPPEVSIARAVGRAGIDDLYSLGGGPVYVRGSDGEFRELGFITEVSFRQEALDVTTFGGTIEYIPGLRRAEFHFRGVL